MSISKTPSSSPKKKRSPYISPAVRAITKHLLRRAIADRRLLAIREHSDASRREISFQFQRVFDWLDAYFKVRGVEEPIARHEPWPRAPMPKKGARGFVGELNYAVRTAVIALRCSPISQTLRVWDMALDDLDVEILSALDVGQQQAIATSASMFHRSNGPPLSGSRA